MFILEKWDQVIFLDLKGNYNFLNKLIQNCLKALILKDNLSFFMMFSNYN